MIAHGWEYHLLVDRELDEVRAAEIPHGGLHPSGMEPLHLVCERVDLGIYLQPLLRPGRQDVLVLEVVRVVVPQVVDYALRAFGEDTRLDRHKWIPIEGQNLHRSWAREHREKRRDVRFSPTFDLNRLLLSVFRCGRPGYYYLCFDADDHASMCAARAWSSDDESIMLIYVCRDRADEIIRTQTELSKHRNSDIYLVLRAPNRGQRYLEDGVASGP
jgi:hypothetical protein